MLIGLIVGVLVGNLIVKNAIQRDRPCWLVEVQDLLIANPQDFSFPSGHTLSSFCAASILFHYDKRLGIPSFGVAILIAFSRLYLYVHFPTDVFAGILIGVAFGMIVFICAEKIRQHFIFKKQNERTS